MALTNPSTDTIKAIDTFQNELREICKKHKVVSISVFGNSKKGFTPAFNYCDFEKLGLTTSDHLAKPKSKEDQAKDLLAQVQLLLLEIVKGVDWVCDIKISGSAKNGIQLAFGDEMAAKYVFPED